VILKEFFRIHKMELIISSIILLLGSIIIHITQNEALNLSDILIWFPLYWVIFILILIVIWRLFFGNKI